MKIGIAVTCHNNLDVLKFSIASFYNKKYLVVLFDDNSDDGTELWIKKNYPSIIYLKGDGNNWWTGSLSKAIDVCLKNNCDSIVSVNADVIITPIIIDKLQKTSIANNNAIVASIVVDVNNVNTILWAGSVFIKIHKLLPIFTSKYKVKAGTLISDVGDCIYQVDEVHGRGVLIPREVFNKIGNYNYKSFPHYGGDTDFSFRAKRSKIKMIVNPSCLAKVFVENTGLKHMKKSSYLEKIKSVINYLIKRKNGEALVVWWKLLSRHLPFYHFLPSYLFIISLNIYRKLFN